MNTIVLDYRGRGSHSVLNDIREYVLSKRPDVDKVEALVDTEKFAKKIELFAAITKRHSRTVKADGYWSVMVTRPACEVHDGSCVCSA